jgi:hypothetical protein
MTKLIVCILSVPLGLALSVPPIAYAGTNSAPGTTQNNAEKSMKAYQKQQKKQLKKTQRAQKKAQKKLQKLHPTGH